MEFETHAKRRRQRARKLAHEREEYFRLMEAGPEQQGSVQARQWQSADNEVRPRFSSRIAP